MAYRGLKRLVIFLIVFAGLVTMLQMLAVSRLSTTSRLPWEEGSENGRAGMKNGKVRAPYQHVCFCTNAHACRLLCNSVMSF